MNIKYNFCQREKNTLWQRDDSLAFIQKAIFVNWVQLATQIVDPYYLKVENKENSVFEDFFTRMIGEVDELKNSLVNLKYFLEKSFADLSEKKFDVQYIFDKNEKDQEEKLDFHKIILLWTKFHTLFAIDSKNGEILWKLNFFVFFQIKLL